MANNISTHLWFDKEAKEAAAFYTSVFNNSEITDNSVLNNTPSGSVDIVTINLAGQEFTLLSAGPLFKFTPAISFLVACNTETEVDQLWEKLGKDGQVMMELGSYPFSKKYGWTQDKYGLSWQIMLTNEHKPLQKITPTLMFVGDVCGQAREAISFYTSIFHDSKVGEMMTYQAGEEPDKEGTIKHADFTLEGQQFAAMDSAHKHQFSFNEAISFMVHCDTQEEIDYYWDKLSAVPESEQCGWLKDKFGVSWQIVPDMGKYFASGDPDKIARVTQAFLKMKKFDLAALNQAAEGK